MPKSFPPSNLRSPYLFSYSLLFLLILVLSSCQLDSEHVSCSGIIYRFTHPVEFPWWVPLGFRHCRGLLSHQCSVLGIATLHNSLGVEQVTLLLKISYLRFHVTKNGNWKRKFMKVFSKMEIQRGDLWKLFPSLLWREKGS